MEKSTYIVLQSRGAEVPTAGTFSALNLRSRGLATEPEHLTLVEAEVDKREIELLRKDSRTRAMAPAMPMKLIEPTAIDLGAAPAAQGPTWGVSAVGADSSPYDGNGVVVAVLDTGIKPDHPAFAGVNLQRQNFTQESDDDVHGHGTHCAGTIFGRDVNGTRIGVGRGVQKALIGKVLGAGGGSSATIAKAIQWAVDEGANVISMSLGIDFPGYVSWLVDQKGMDIAPATSLALEGYRANVDLFNNVAGFVRSSAAFQQASILVAASGNESARPQYEIAVGLPAAAVGFLAVGALQNGAAGMSVAEFSNTQVGVAAPGVDILSAGIAGGLAKMSGTSMAAPHVAGVAALWAHKMLDESGHLDPIALSSRVIASGTLDPIVPSHRDFEDVGTGLVRAPQ